MFKNSDVMFNADQLFQLNYGYIVVEVSLFHLLCNHCFQKLKNPVVTEPLVYINECFTAQVHIYKSSSSFNVKKTDFDPACFG